jgi:hypothetical protein
VPISTSWQETGEDVVLETGVVVVDDETEDVADEVEQDDGTVLVVG